MGEAANCDSRQTQNAFAALRKLNGPFPTIFPACTQFPLLHPFASSGVLHASIGLHFVQRIKLYSRQHDEKFITGQNLDILPICNLWEPFA